jgi:site-specific recombinase XerD
MFTIIKNSVAFGLVCCGHNRRHIQGRENTMRVKNSEIRNRLPSGIPETVNMFLMYKKASGLSERTTRDYENILNHFFRLYPNGMETPRQSCLEYLTRYANPYSYNQRIAYLKCFWDWCISEEIIPGKMHPLAKMKKRKTQGRIVQLEEREVARLLKQPDLTRYTGLRDHALMCLQLDTGIRPSEALQLVPDDFKADKQEIVVRAEISKTRQARTLPISAPTAKEILTLLKVRPNEWGDVNIFCSENGSAFTVSAWSRRVTNYSKSAGLERLTSYSLRHTAALLLLRRGADAFTVQRMLGHADMQMTRHYINLTREDVRRNHAQAGVINALLHDEKGSKAPKMQRIRIIKY